MTDTPLLDWKQAEARRETGMSRAVEHADEVHGDWSDMAMEMLREYADAMEDRPFMAEQVRNWARTYPGWIDPPDKRAWGAVFTRAAKAGHIVKLGYAPAKSSNLSPKVLWGRA